MNIVYQGITKEGTCVSGDRIENQGDIYIYSANSENTKFDDEKEEITITAKKVKPNSVQLLNLGDPDQNVLNQIMSLVRTMYGFKTDVDIYISRRGITLETRTTLGDNMRKV